MPGTIVFRPIEANIVTKDKDVLGKMDPYLSFHVGGLKRVKSQVCQSGGNHPVWNDSVTVEVGNQNSLTVDLKDKDMLIDDKIGSFEIDLREVESQGQIRKWYPIFRKNEPAGELLMEASFNGGNFGGYGQQGLGHGTGLIAGQSLNQGYSHGLNQGLNQGYNQGLNQGSLAGHQGSLGGGYPQTTVISSTSVPVQSGFQNQSLGSHQLGTQQLGTHTMGTHTMGTHAIDTHSLGTNTLGTQPLGTQPLGTQSFGTQPLGTHSFGTQPLGTQPLGTQSFGAQPLGTEQFGQLNDPLQFAREALVRGTDPLNTQQNFVHNMGNQGVGFGQPGFNNQGMGQNLTQTPNYSGTDPLLYEGDKNRFTHPAQQMSFGTGSVLRSDPHNNGGKLDRKY